MPTTIEDFINSHGNVASPIRYASQRIGLELDRKRAEELRLDLKPECSLREYTREAWSIVEPAVAFVDSWHLGAICEHLEAVMAGQIQNLLINIPPRHSKSLMVSVFWFTHAWTYMPWLRWLFSSYAQSLSTRDSVKSRRMIESSFYQRRWNDKFQLTGDQNQKTRFENDKTGYRLATSVGGANTGEGGDIIVVDDPLDIRQRHSTSKRETVLVWWDELMSNRLNNQKTGHKVIIMQRLHDEDLSGHVLKGGGYEHLRLPAEFNPDKRCITSLGWQDPRTTRNELLCPERFGPKEIEEIGKPLGIAGRSAILNQDPIMETGSMFDAKNWKIVETLPVEGLLATTRFWDCAGTEDDGDYTVGLKMNRYKDGTFIITDVVRGQFSTADVQKTIELTAAMDGRRVRIREEQEPGSSGKSVVNSRRVTLAGYDYEGIKSTGDKRVRARPLAVQQEAGNIKLLMAPWNKELIDEYKVFPFGGYDDQVDGGSGAFNDLTFGSARRRVRMW